MKMPAFLSVKEIPTLFWSSPITFTLRPPAVSFGMLVVGLFLFGLGEAMLVAAGVGVSPWTVFAEGLVIQTGWSLGFATLIISLAILALWIPLKRVPGVGTVMNALIIAGVLEFVLPWLPTFNALAGQVVYAIAGVLVTGIGGAIYLISNLGPGPRDGLMTGLQALTGQPVARVRAGIEIAAVSVGWLLGGTVGLGTVIFALGIGPAMALGLWSLARIFRAVQH